MNHYPRHVGDYIRDTVGLSMLEDGAYNRLLDQYYVTEKPLPLDADELYRMARASQPAERKAVDYVVGKFFIKSDDGYRQKRTDAEILAYQERAEIARENGKRGGRKANPERTKSVPDGFLFANQTANQEETKGETNLKPVTSNQSIDLVGQMPDEEPQKIKELRKHAIEVLLFLNEKTGRRYEPVRANIAPLIARFKEGFTPTTARQIVAKKCREWGTDERMEQYLRPATLFNATNFANYAGEIGGQQ